MSVITTAHNAAQFLPASIDSVLAQTFHDFELVVVDDGSTDDTAGAVAAAGDDRVRLLTPGRIGRAAALNLAIESSHGEYLAVLDADDLALPERLERQVAFLDSHPEIDIVGSHRTLTVDARGAALGELDNGATTAAGIIRAMRRGGPASVHSAVMMRRSFAVAAGGYDPSLLIGLDIDLMSKAVATGSFANLAEPVAAHRIHDRQFFRFNVRRLSPWDRFRAKLQLQDRVLGRIGEPRRYRWIPVFLAVGRRLRFPGRH